MSLPSLETLPIDTLLPPRAAATYKLTVQLWYKKHKQGSEHYVTTYAPMWPKELCQKENFERVEAHLKAELEESSVRVIERLQGPVSIGESGFVKADWSTEKLPVASVLKQTGKFEESTTKSEKVKETVLDFIFEVTI